MTRRLLRAYTRELPAAYKSACTTAAVVGALAAMGVAPYLGWAIRLLASGAVWS